MRIAIVVSSISPGGGLTKYVCSLCEILSSEPDNKIFLISTHSSSRNEKIENLKASGKIEYVSLAQKGKLGKYFSLIRELNHFNPDVVINNYNATTQYILPLLKHGTKVVHILHNDTDDFYRVGSINGKYVAGWITPTTAVAENFNRYTHNKYRDRVSVIPHGVENGLDRNVANAIPELTFVGALYAHKGVVVLPQIIKQLELRGKIFKFNIIGEGDFYGYLQESLAQEIESGIVNMTGVIPGREVYRYLSQTDIFVYPTKLDSFGLVIAEAMINGAIPVVSLLPGITNELVTDGEYGYLVEPDNVDEFVAHISALLDDESLRNKMSSLAKENANVRFPLEAMKRNYINYLKTL